MKIILAGILGVFSLFTSSTNSLNSALIKSQSSPIHSVGISNCDNENPQKTKNIKSFEEKEWQKTLKKIRKNKRRYFSYKNDVVVTKISLDTIYVGSEDNYKTSRLSKP